MHTSIVSSRPRVAPGAVALGAAALVGSAGLPAVALVPAGLAAVVDARTGRLPNALVTLAAVPSAAYALRWLVAGELGRSLAVAAGALLFALPVLAVHLVAPGAMGFGDVKLAAALGLLAGTVDPRLALVALCVASGSTATFGLVARRRSVPFGPGLVVGAAVVLLVGSTVAG